jgi:mycofactocin system glycosyltransferase
LEVVTTELVAFVDSDCTVGAGWLDELLWHFEDPDVVAVAPRVLPLGGAERHRSSGRRSALDRFAASHSPLDMGPSEGSVGPDRLVRYVPTAALIVRREALAAPFDPALRVGEDVDLIWRLIDDGGEVRYVPDVVVHHEEPTTWSGLLARRYRYGTSAGVLALRHPDRLAPVELRPWPTLCTLALLVGRTRIATVSAVAMGLTSARRFQRQGLPVPVALRASATGTAWTTVAIGRAATMLLAPALVVAGTRSRRASVTVALLVLLPPVVEWFRRRPDLDVGTWTVASIADDVAYGTGVWVGCLRARSIRPLLPTVRRRGAVR